MTQNIEGLAKLILSTPVVELPPALQNLTEPVQFCISDTLANNECLSDEELVNYLIQDCAVPAEAAQAAIRFRTAYLVNPLFDLFSPIASRL